MAEPAPVAVTEELPHRLVATTVPVTAGAEEPAAADWLETAAADDEAASELAAALEVETAALEVVGWAVLWLK